jgi:hypothetical protein
MLPPAPGRPSEIVASSGASMPEPTDLLLELFDLLVETGPLPRDRPTWHVLPQQVVDVVVARSVAPLFEF